MYIGAASESVLHSDIIFAEADENNARADLSPQELRDFALKLGKIEDNDEMLAAAAGLLPARIMSGYFAHLDDRLRQTRQDSAKARADAHYMALLQTQIAEWDSQIELLDKEISELETLRDIIASGEFDPNNPDHAALRDRTPITQNEIDDGSAIDAIDDEIKDRQSERDAISAERERAQERLTEMKGQTREVAENIAVDVVENDGAAAVAAVSRNLDELEQQIADTASGNSDFGGNAAQQNDNASNFGLSGLSFDDAFGAPSGSLSTAHGLGEDNPLRSNAPPMRQEFETASAQTDIVKPDAKVELSTEQDLSAVTPVNNLG